MKKIILLALIVLSSCVLNNKKNEVETVESNNDTYIIDIDNVKKEGIIKTSSLFKDVTTIPLETKENCLIGEISNIQITDDYIFVLDKKHAESLYGFHKNGSFFMKYGNVGHGPGEYLSISDFTINKDDHEILIFDNHSMKVLCYDMNSGDYIRSIPVSGEGLTRFNIQYVENILYMDNYSEEDLDEGSYLMNYIYLNNPEKEHQILKSTDYNKGFSGIILTNDSFYSRTYGSPKYISFWGNTILSLNADSVTPYAVLKSSKFISKDDLKGLDFKHDNDAWDKIYEKNKIYRISNYLETDQYIYFQFLEGLTGNTILFYKNDRSVMLFDIIMDDMVYANPEKAVLFHNFICSDSKGLYAYIHPHKMHEFYEIAQNGFLSKSIQEENFLSNLKEDSNPIIFFYSTDK
ncbi:6-bladed beta-propeller [Parabacteroides sp. PFB2-10]|uniref:6-bladed beta-propeller n=1 Tax=Parabacteroides sp. PFB2-10 TaxID=1742405 RepID=UPI0024736346|nr:6-bladed beta-propeller [Parabacteroides sp. PFB2-10]MDL2244588.1 6-bladed beta-propeller [Parabacteroides sp. OttesenSCG-928-J18]